MDPGLGFLLRQRFCRARTAPAVGSVVARLPRLRVRSTSPSARLLAASRRLFIARRRAGGAGRAPSSQPPFTLAVTFSGGGEPVAC